MADVRATGEELYHPLGDMHWNAAGHRAWFAGARRDLERLLTRSATGT